MFSESSAKELPILKIEYGDMRETEIDAASYHIPFGKGLSEILSLFFIDSFPVIFINKAITDIA